MVRQWMISNGQTVDDIENVRQWMILNGQTVDDIEWSDSGRVEFVYGLTTMALFEFTALPPNWVQAFVLTIIAMLCACS